ncbi:hypothetical protein [Tenacibaculum sp. 190524A02b]|uniref:hypothetical protein n=1 Tax=Tenacibaculum vairaonense TaxID=3137860 RepID=UPI0031FB410F
MNYYLDTEFLEGPQKRRLTDITSKLNFTTFVLIGIISILLLNYAINTNSFFIWIAPAVLVFYSIYNLIVFSDNKPTIDLISIGIVSEDGREYYAISKDFNLKEAWNRYHIIKDFVKPQGLGDKKVYWIRENVLKPIFDELVEQHNNRVPYVSMISDFSYKNMKKLIKRYGKSNEQIAKEIKEFSFYYDGDFNQVKRVEKPKFHAYYADYDWVVFCWLFGRMIDLPEGFPMYCIDLKQELDRKILIKSNKMFGKIDAEGRYGVYQNIVEYSFEERLEIVKSLAKYPKQESKHNALDDARWNKKLHYFLNNL